MKTYRIYCENTGRKLATYKTTSATKAKQLAVNDFVISEKRAVRVVVSSLKTRG